MRAAVDDAMSDRGRSSIFSFFQLLQRHLQRMLVLGNRTRLIHNGTAMGRAKP